MNENFVPSVAKHRIRDLFSDDATPETRANAARWYAEMMIKEFLLPDEEVGEGGLVMSLKDLVKKVRKQYGNKIADKLEIVRYVGCRGSHYIKDGGIEDRDAREAVAAAFQVYPLLIAKVLRDKPLCANHFRATIFSVISPDMRIMIIEEIIDFDALDERYNLELLHKWCLACVKAGKRDKARRKLRQLRKRNAISEETFEFESSSVDVISDQFANNKLPVAKNNEDFVRNLRDVKSMIGEKDIIDNRDILAIFDKMANDIPPSEMGPDGMKLFLA